MNKALKLLLLLCWFMPHTSSAAANLIPNASFECGVENWLSYGPGCCTTGYGWDTSPSGQLTSTNSVHGSNSMMFPRTRGFTQPLRLLAGNYVFAFSAMASSSVTLENVICSDDYVSPTTNGCSSPAFALTTSWARYTNFLTISSNGFFSMRWYRASPTPIIWIDAVQWETGTVASAYAPMATVEIGLTTTNLVHMLRGTSPFIQLKAWNNGGTIGMTSIVQVFDYSNTNFYTVSVSTNALVSGPTTINVPVSRYGALRATAYQPTVNSSMNELLFTILPHPPGTVNNTNGMIGLHPTYSPFAQGTAVAAGYSMARDLSPARCVRWADQQVDGTGPFTFDPYCASYMSTNGLVPLMVLTPGLDGGWPAAATNALGQADTNAWWLYCWTNAIRYSQAPSNCFYWEIGNEWQGILTPTDFSTSPSNRARFTVVGAQAVRAGCPNCTIAVIAGEYTASEAFQTWTNMTNMVAGDLSLFNVISAHIYPYPGNPNDGDDDLSRGSAAQPWVQLFGSTGKPIWDTEMGQKGGRGGHLGPLKMASPLYQTYGTLIPEAGRDYVGGQRKIVPVDFETRQMMRTLGAGFSKVFVYTSDNPSDTLWFSGFNAQTMEFNGALRQGTTAALIGANYFARYPGLGRVTNSSAGVGLIEAYYFTNVLGTVVVIWCSDNIERTLTLTNGNFAVCDAMGNYNATNLTSVIINRTPEYFVSGTLSTAQLKATVESATAAAYSDVTGPNISVDISPIGIVTNDTFVFKWTVLDRNKQVWSIGTYSPDETNNRSRVKFYAEDSWRDVGVSNHCIVPLTINRQYNCIVEGKDFYNNINVVTGAAFGILALPTTPIVLNVSGTLNIGTITIQP